MNEAKRKIREALEEMASGPEAPRVGRVGMFLLGCWYTILPVLKAFIGLLLVSGLSRFIGSPALITVGLYLAQRLTRILLLRSLYFGKLNIAEVLILLRSLLRWALVWALMIFLFGLFGISLPLFLRPLFLRTP